MISYFTRIHKRQVAYLGRGRTMHFGPETLWNLNEAQLFERAVKQAEGLVSQNGAFVVQTGANTGRAVQDKFIVLDDVTRDAVWWDRNAKMSRAHFDALYADVEAYTKGKCLFVQDLYACADPVYRLKTRVVTQYAWHSLFIRHLLIVPPKGSSLGVDCEAEFTVLTFPEFEANPARHGARTGTMIACDFTRRIVIIVGTAYAGEIKKSVFTMLNFLLPERGVMPMHCSVNVGREKDSAIFFGLSGTGKTTLSADSARILIGDDEHGWSPSGLFNFEGGCYAKAIRLSAELEPEIYAATQRFGVVLENVVIDEETRQLDFNSDRFTENTRAAYPIHFIPNACMVGMAPHPRNIILLTADAFGVMPPVARLNDNQAIYHFLSGYTARVSGTEKGLKEPEATFSACFGAPFMARHPFAYGQLLRQFIREHRVTCWLLNTGWTGGPYGTGKRISLKDTRHILAAILDGSLQGVPMERDDIFGFEVPTKVSGLESENILFPRKTWGDPAAYDETKKKVAQLFRENFDKLALTMEVDIINSGPICAHV